jgi:hypothetical protein
MLSFTPEQSRDLAETQNGTQSPTFPVLIKAFERLHMVLAANSGYCGSKYSRWTSGSRLLGASSLPSINAAISGITVPMETGLRIHKAWKLGVCFSSHERHSAIVAGNTVALLQPPYIEAGCNNEACDVSHVPAHVWNASECEWGECQSRSGVVTSRQPQGYDRCVYAGRNSSEAGSPKQAGKDGHGSGAYGRKDVGLTGPNWTMTKTKISC